MNIIGNIIWWIFGGLITAMLWLIIGIILCCTVVFIPFGLQCIKTARLILWPFGSEIVIGQFGFGGFIFNIIWILLIGWELAIAHLIGAVLCTLTVIGIPFAIQHVKLAKLALLPFGAKIR